MMAIQSGGGEYARIDSSDKKSSTPANSEAYQNTADLVESTSGPSVTNELSIEDAIEILGMGIFQRRILWAAGLCFAADSMEILLLSFLTVVLRQDWQLTETQTSTITFSVFAGALLGSLTLGPLGDSIGRRPVFTLAASIISVFGLLTALANSYASLLLMRFLVGFGVGGLTIPFDTLSEFLPASHRGVNLLVIEYFWTAGSLLVPVFAFISLGLDGGSWQLFCVLCAIPCVISSILGTLVVPESPRWLTARGRSQQALDILRKAAVTNGHEDPVALFPLDTVLTTEEEHSTMRDLVSPKWCKITLRIWGASLGMAFLYYGAILAITMIFSSTEEEEQQDSDTFNFDYTAIIASSSAEIVGLTLVILTVDTKGRIPSQTMCYVMGGTCVFLLCLFASMEMPRALLLTCSFSARLFMMGATCLTWVSTSEILATEIRSTGHAAANAISRVGGAICPFIVSERTPLLAIGCIMLFVALVTAWFVHKLPETMGQGMGVAAIAEGKAHIPSSPLRNCYASTELSTLTVTPTRIPTTRGIL